MIEQAHFAQLDLRDVFPVTLIYFSKVYRNTTLIRVGLRKSSDNLARLPEAGKRVPLTTRASWNSAFR